MYKKKWLAHDFPENPHADLRSLCRMTSLWWGARYYYYYYSGHGPVSFTGGSLEQETSRLEDLGKLFT